MATDVCSTDFLDVAPTSIAPDAWYNHLGGRPGVLGTRLAGLNSVKFCLPTGEASQAGVSTRYIVSYIDIAYSI
jgi:hypothetical protein